MLKSLLKIRLILVWLYFLATVDQQVIFRNRNRAWTSTFGDFHPRLSQTDRPKEIKLVIHLWEYVERVKNLKLDKWQINFCNRLEKAFFERDENAMKAAIAVPPQHGKSVIISQAYLSWIVGHDPHHRVVLACYNLERTRKHLQAVISIFRGQSHKSIFTDASGHIPNVVSDKSFSTFARLRQFDGQHNFTAVSLLTGLVGIGFDTLIIDDPYKSSEEALSMTYREKSWRFYEETAQMRGGDNGNIFIMFHRYHQDDMGGRALATKEFDYWHYAAQYIGDYKDEDTGLIYPDSYPRADGEYLSERRSPAYYERQKRIPSVWNSQFQQRPVGADGNKFDVSKVRRLDRRPDPSEFLFMVRSWDNAATADGGDFSVGTLTGFRADETATILDVVRGQWNSGDRLAKQTETAERDGKMVIITHPDDPGSAGKDASFQFQQNFAEYVVEIVPTTESKEIRAHPYSIAVNQGKYTIVEDEKFTDEWIKEHKFFPVGTYKDQVDSGADGYRVGYNKLRRGLVVKSFDNYRNVVSWDDFEEKIGKSIPNHWNIYAAIQINQDKSLPSGAVLVARAAKNAFIGESIFVLGCFKQLNGDMSGIVRWLEENINKYVQPKRNSDGTTKQKEIPLLWMSDESSDMIQTALKKLKVNLRIFDGNAASGIPEMNWYFDADKKIKHPFDPIQNASRLYLLSNPKQVDEPINEAGLLSLRQELVTWTYNSKHEPQEFGGVVANCLRMILSNFKPQAAEFTIDEKIEQAMPETLRVAHIATIENEEEKVGLVTARRIEHERVKQTFNRPKTRNPLNKLRKK